VVWQETRFRCAGHNDIVISQSSDDGATWSALQPVNGPDPNGQVLDHFTPDVAAYGGNVHVTYRTRDFAGKAPSEFVDERYIVSTDGGATFGGEMVLGPPADLKYAAEVVGGRAFLGDYMGVVANADVAHADWCVALFEKNSRYNQTLWAVMNAVHARLSADLALHLFRVEAARHSLQQHVEGVPQQPPGRPEHQGRDHDGDDRIRAPEMPHQDEGARHHRPEGPDRVRGQVEEGAAHVQGSASRPSQDPGAPEVHRQSGRSNEQDAEARHALGTGQAHRSFVQ